MSCFSDSSRSYFRGSSRISFRLRDSLSSFTVCIQRFVCNNHTGFLQELIPGLLHEILLLFFKEFVLGFSSRKYFRDSFETKCFLTSQKIFPSIPPGKTCRIPPGFTYVISADSSRIPPENHTGISSGVPYGNPP